MATKKTTAKKASPKSATKAKDGRSIKTAAHREAISKGLKAYHAGKGSAKTKQSAAKKTIPKKYRDMSTKNLEKLAYSSKNKPERRMAMQALDAKGKTTKAAKKARVVALRNKASSSMPDDWNNKHPHERNAILTKHHGPMRGFTQAQKKAMWKDMPKHKRK